MILVIDNYDSFVYNLARYVALANNRCRVVRNDKISLDQVEALNPDGIVISPGPCTPKEAGISTDIVRRFGPTIPILGVCLGHQCIGEAYGGETIRSERPVHGMSSSVIHTGSVLYNGIPQFFTVGRYHSLTTKLPDNAPLLINARSEKDEIMGFEHRTHPVYGVQFHPESVLTEHGQTLIDNFSTIAQDWRKESKNAA